MGGGAAPKAHVGGRVASMASAEGGAGGGCGWRVRRAGRVRSSPASEASGEGGGGVSGGRSVRRDSGGARVKPTSVGKPEALPESRSR